LEWYATRMGQRNVVKNIFKTKPEDKGKVLWPKLRRLEDSENYLREYKVKRWQKNQIIKKNEHPS
jgi:hypothetical protein